MTLFKKGVLVSSLLLFGAAGCADLEVTNPNQPDAQRALETAGDLESLVAGAFKQWQQTSGDYYSISFALSTTSFQHSAWPANAGMVFYSDFPRPQLPNEVAHQFYGNLEYPWNGSYRALAALQQGLSAIANWEGDFAAELVPEGTAGERAARMARLNAYAKFTQGIAHASLAMLFDQAFVVDETVDIQGGEAVELQPYTDVMAAALGYFDDAIAIAGANSFEVPAAWIGGVSMSDTDMIGIAHGLKARYMAAVARDPAERAAVNWTAVRNELAEAQPWHMALVAFDYANWTADLKYYPAYAGWQQLTYWILGMADQSGTYQDWVEVPIAERIPEVNGEPFLIITPDQRFAQGATLAAQTDDSYDRYPLYGVPPFSLANNFQKPERGTWRWSYYWTYDAWLNFGSETWPEVSQAEIDLLRAEAEYRLNGNAPNATAIALVDMYRTAAGLDSSAGANEDCVPKLPNGNCGDFFEQLKWEKRINTQFRGMLMAPWYFEGRGWGDLYEGTALHFPVPCGEAYVLNLLPCYTYGADAGAASPGSVYNWPTES